MAELTPIHPRYLRDQAFLSLRAAIVSGALEPGSPLVIDSLAETFGLSTMPVREAVKRLVADGLVEEGWVDVREMVTRQPWLDGEPFPVKQA